MRFCTVLTGHYRFLRGTCSAGVSQPGLIFRQPDAVCNHRRYGFAQLFGFIGSKRELHHLQSCYNRTIADDATLRQATNAQLPKKFECLFSHHVLVLRMDTRLAACWG